jgi:hypothetical protein
MTEVINIYHNRPYDVYCGRAGKGEDGYFGNPIKLSPNEPRGSTLAKFKEYFLNRIKTDAEFATRVEALRGKKLGCFCAPSPCHVMIIIEYLDGKSIEQQMKEYTESMGKHVSENIFEGL